MRDEIRRRLFDVAVAVVVALLLMARATVPFEEGAPEPDWRVYALMGAFGAVLLWRRRHPLGTLLATAVLFQAYYMLGFGAIGAIWPFAPALFNAALYDRTRAAIVVAAVVLAGSGAWRFFLERESDTLLVFNDIVSEAVLATAVILAGTLVVSRRKLRAEMGRREAAVAAERDAVAQRKLSEQRLHIAREVHDVVAHSLAGIGVQARLADELVDDDRDGTRTALRAVIDSTSEAIQRLRETVGGLRDASSTPSVPELVASATGVDVTLGAADDISDLPDVEAAVRSVVREAITNVVRHAEATTAQVRVERQPASVVVEVVDDGRGGELVEGHGVLGMRERVASVGGVLEAGSGLEGGFRVRAEIPL